MQNKNFHLNKKSKLREFLQGDDLNLVGTILTFMKGKHIKPIYNDLTGENLNWFGVILYLDHLTGRIERYDINNSDINSETQLKMKELYKGKKVSLSLDKVFYTTFMINLFNTYFLLKGIGQKSYLNPFMPLVKDDLSLSNNTNLLSKDRIEIIPSDILKGRPVLNIPSIFYDIPNVSLAISSTFNLNNFNTVEHPQIVKELKGRISSRRIKNIESLVEAILKFNEDMEVKINKLIEKDNKN